MTSTIWLFSEDVSDANIVSLILQKQSIPVQIKPVELIGNKRGIPGLAHELPLLIKATLTRMEPQDCIAVLIDAEFAKSRQDRVHHKMISDICAQYQDIAVLVLAIQEIEAWLLADSGICAYLGIEPANCDSMPEPKEELIRLLRHKKRRKWQGADRRIVTLQLAGDSDKLSPSLRKALHKLRKHLNMHGG